MDAESLKKLTNKSLDLLVPEEIVKLLPLVLGPSVNKTANHKDDFHGLTAREKAAILFVRTMYSTKDTLGETIFRTQEAVITAQDMQCLTLANTCDGSEKYLSNGLIDGYAAHMKNNMQDKSKKRLFCPVRFGFMMSDDTRVNDCLDPEIIHNYQYHVTEFYSYELVFFPIQVKNGDQEHWIVVVMNTKKQEFQVLDSLWNLDMYKNTIYNLRYGIARLTTAARAVDPSIPSNVHSWDIQFIKGVPRQHDGSSCGLCVMQFMEHWDGNILTIDLTQYEVTMFRKKLVAELLFSNVNEITNTKDEVNKLIPHKKKKAH